MPHPEGPPETRVINPDLANVIGHYMTETAHLPMALEAQREKGDVAAKYHWDKAYQYGLDRTTAWLSSLADAANIKPILDDTTNRRLIRESRTYEVTPNNELPKNPLDCRILGRVASQGEEGLIRPDLQRYLHTKEITIFHATTRLLKAEFLSRSEEKINPVRLFPTAKLMELTTFDNEVTVWKDVYTLGDQLSLTTEIQVLHYLASLGHATLAPITHKRR